MEASELRQIIALLPENQPITDKYEGRPYPPGRVWYTSQKEHLVGWLGEYGGAGAYGRKNPGQDARYFYTHFQCAPGLLWLAEALGEDAGTLRAAIRAIEGAGPKGVAQCGAFRQVIPWSRIEELLQRGREPFGEAQENRVFAFVEAVRAASFSQMLVAEEDLWQRLNLHEASPLERQGALAALGERLKVTPHTARKAIYFEWSASHSHQPPGRTKAKGKQKVKATREMPPMQPIDLSATDMRAISIRQPYAELIVRGEKVKEFRSWATATGPILIHASKTVTAEEQRAARKAGIDLDAVDRGALVGIVDVVDIEGVEGDYAWLLAYPRRFTAPIGYKGAVGIIRVPIDKVRTELQRLEKRSSLQKH